MADVLLKMTAPSVYTYRAKNIDNISITSTQPVSPLPLPEDSWQSGILTKFEGNSLTVTVVWVIQDETATVVDQLTGSSIIDTAEKQRNFLISTFESKGISYKYKLEFDGVTPAFAPTGVFTKITLVKTGSEPVTYRATAEFIAGIVT